MFLSGQDFVQSVKNIFFIFGKYGILKDQGSGSGLEKFMGSSDLETWPKIYY